MRLANVPPPMAQHDIEINRNIIDVAIKMRSNPRPVATIGVLHHQGYSQFEWSPPSMSQNPPVCSFTNDFWPIETDTIANRDRLYIQISFSGNASLLFSKSIDESNITVTGEDGGHLSQISLHGTDIEGIISESWTSKSKTYVMLDHDSKSNAEELEARAEGLNDASMAGIELALSPFSIQRVDAIACDFENEPAVNSLANGTETLVKKNIVFSLAENGGLFANERRLARNCTSFLVTSAHLIFTTSQHLLKFVHLARDTEGELPLTQLLIRSL